MAIQEELRFPPHETHAIARASAFTPSGFLSLAREGRNVFIVGFTCGVIGVALLTTQYGHTVDAAVTVVSVAMVVAYLLICHLGPLVITDPPADARPAPRSLMPFLISVTFAVVCWITALIVGISGAIYLTLDLTWAVAGATLLIKRLVLASALFVSFAVVSLFVQIALTHWDRVVREIRKAFWIFEAHFRFPHQPHL